MYIRPDEITYLVRRVLLRFACSSFRRFDFLTLATLSKFTRTHRNKGVRELCFRNRRLTQIVSYSKVKRITFIVQFISSAVQQQYRFAFR